MKRKKLLSYGLTGLTASAALFGGTVATQAADKKPVTKSTKSTKDRLWKRTRT